MAEAREPALTIGSVFQGGYEIVAPLGSGGFGWVYKARQLSTGQDVAIKVLRVLAGDSAADIANQSARFRREMRLCAGLAHPNIVRIIDSGETSEGTLYAVFELVPGVTLRQVLADEGKLEVPEAVHLMSEVLDALACAHARGVVHRDLKPDNVMISKTGARRHALVLDFGLGGFSAEGEGWELPRITATREAMGTPCYAAPEQLRGEPPQARSDLYSWGLIFLECLTGELAISGGSAADVIWKQLGPDPVPIPASLRTQRLGRLLEIVTAKQIEKRDVTIPGLLEALGAIQGAGPASGLEARRTDDLPDGERRQLTIVSCRLSVRPLERRSLDPEEMDEALHAQHARYAELAARAGGQTAGVLADRVLLVFGYPRAREDDARRAARTALAIAEEAARATRRLETERGLRLEVRVGLHTGLVVVRELRQATFQGLYDLVGLTPQIAARLDERAAPGEVLVSADTHRLLRGEIATEAVGDIQPWADAGSMAVFRLVAQPGPSGVRVTPSASETPLIGRVTPLRDLLEVWTSAQRGHPGAVLMRGEPGIGKSRLVRELRHRLPAEGWLEARCVAENEGSPLRPFVDLLLALGEPIETLLLRYGFEVPETLPLFATLLSQTLDPRFVAAQLTPDLQKERTLRAVLEFIMRMAQERPIVLAIEDLHWADPTTLELTQLLLQEVRSAAAVASDPPLRLGVVLTARPDLTPPWPLEDVTLIQLTRLARPDIEEMIGAGLATGRVLPRAVIDKVVECSDGVPLFVEEVTRVLLRSVDAERGERAGAENVEMDVPSTLRELLTGRLDGLSSSARETIQVAAILGRELRYELLDAVAHKDEALLREDLRELIDAGLFFPRRSMRGEGYVFKHSLVRDAAYESMTRPRRLRLLEIVCWSFRDRFF
jgi:TOMM system kinase/cyclase fusion protein